MKIKMLVMDVDGTLTDGCIYMGPEGEAMKAFHAKDGYGIVHILPKLGILPVVITGRSSQILQRRCQELNIPHLYQGIGDKLAKLKELCRQLRISPEDIACIGDDLNDLSCLQYCGYAGCPNDAVEAVRENVNYICRLNGGHGAVREFIDHLNRILTQKDDPTIILDEI